MRYPRAVAVALIVAFGLALGLANVGAQQPRDQYREYYGGADGDVWTFDATRNRWAPAAPTGGGGGGGDITGVTAGTGLTGGGASGAVTLNLDSPVTVLHGGTGDTTAAGARTNLGLAIGSDVAAFSHNHAGTDITTGTVGTARLGSGSATSATFLRGDGTWATPAGGGSAGLTTLSMQRQTSGATLSYAVPAGEITGTNQVIVIDLQTFTGTSGNVVITISFGGVTIFTQAGITANQRVTWKIRMGYLTDTTFWVSHCRFTSSSALSDQSESLTISSGSFSAGATFTSTMTGGTNPCSRVLEVAKVVY